MTSQWQPITSAPMDGTEVLVWQPQPHDVAVTGYMFVAGFREWAGGWAVGEDAYVVKPTLWMPLPPEPELTQTDESDR